MDFDTQKIFKGLMDFFSILLTSALLTFLLTDFVVLSVLQSSYSKIARDPGQLGGRNDAR